MSNPANNPTAARRTSGGLTRVEPEVSLVHDTFYRRLRRQAISRLHDLDDRVSNWRRTRRKILFEAASPMSFAIFRPVYALLRQDPRLEIWLTAYGRSRDPHAVFEPFGITARVVSAAAAQWMKVDAYINADFWDTTWLHRRTRRLHLFHGVAGKYALDAPVEIAPVVASFDSLMFANLDRRRRYVEAGLVPDDPVRAALVGFPKVDCLVDGSLDRAEIARQLALDARVPTAIYAPTWSPHSSLNTMGEEIIERLAAEGLQVVVKLHDRSYDPQERGSGGIDWAARLRRYDSHPLVRIVRDADASPYLVVSDAMVSDHSSVAFEYTILDRPLAIVDRPELLRQAGINPEKVRQLRSAADVAADARGAAAAVVRGLQSPQRLSAQRRQIAGVLFHQPGTASARAARIIYEMVELPAPIAVTGATRESDSAASLAAVG
ncbi:MAG TPA: CDP-glycerol glycerophosphotransferase family protein [Vicinamibacterales bacterium]|nr:CDP-glycerol glycerophosphotransferase family protein [Vicinamibacterales bacterium]